MEDLLAVDVIAEDDGDLRNIPPSGAIGVWSSLGRKVSAIPEKSHLFGLQCPLPLKGSFELHFGSQHYWRASRYAETTSCAKASVQELDSEMLRLREADTEVAPLRGIGAHLQE